MFDALLCCAGERKVTAKKIVSKTKKEALHRPSTQLISAGVVPLGIFNTSDKRLIYFPLAWQAKKSALQQNHCLNVSDRKIPVSRKRAIRHGWAHGLEMI